MRRFLCRLFRMTEGAHAMALLFEGCFSTDALQSKRYFPAIVFTKNKNPNFYIAFAYGKCYN